jgi:hypothetical protein
MFAKSASESMRDETVAAMRFIVVMRDVRE